ncbi:MAG: helix-turn-helix transcriptional regulator [Bacteroidota bacterium]
MISLNLTPVLRARNIERPYSYLVKNGFTHHTAMNLLDPSTASVRMVHLDRLCRVLHCVPADLFVWKPDKNNPLPDSHPLQSIRLQKSAYNWKEVFSTIPLDQLKEIAKIINTTAKPDLPGTEQ